MKKNDTYRVTAEDYTIDGSAVVRIEGIVFFVPGLIIGEEAIVGITALKKNYGYARIIEIVKPSDQRITPPCSVYRLCGGCTLQHMNTEAQKYFKEDKLKKCFHQNAGMEIEPLPIIRTKEEYGYRNKVQIPVQYKDGQVLMGFYQNHTNRVIPYEKCLVQTDLSNQITDFFREKLKKYGIAQEFRHVLVKHAHHTGEVMIVMITRHYPFDHMEDLKKDILSSFPAVKSLSVIENRREDNVILDGNEYLLAGREYIEEELLGDTFRISARSFYQINPYATEYLYKTAIEYADLHSDEILVDLYCGTGTMGILAAKKAKRVYGIEIVPDAVRDAEINAEANHVSNITFLNTDAGKGAQRILRSRIKTDAVIVDPPRKGCSKETIDAIIKISPRKLVYVSCDPATLARDVKILTENGYKVNKIQPIDMFPQTFHVETVVLLTKQ